MTLQTLSLMALATFLAALGLTRLVRGFARSRHLLDRPNERSAHVIPTPRLGGIGLMVPFLVAGMALAWAQPDGHRGPMMTLLAATGAMSMLGLIDDLHPLPARWRLAVHAAAASIVVLSRGQATSAALAPFGDILPAPVVVVVAIVWIVWATNLYNFMDGIDGLAGGQAVFASLGLAGAALAAGNTAVAALLLFLAVSAGGFLRYNLPKASIFMGDVGSTAIGFFLAALPFASDTKPVPVLAVALALSLFVLDATTTLLRRLLRGERWYTPHRTHLYQQPLAWGVPHGPITYTAYLGMAVAAAMAAVYPSASFMARLMMFAVACILFLAAHAVVRGLARQHHAPPGGP